jgi:hypothetical protein
MENVSDYIAAAIKTGTLCAVMGWDEKHGPTEEQWEAFKVLFPEHAA